MCLIGLAVGARPDLPLLIAANRDERYDRPAAPLAFWDDHPDIAGGRDLEAGGSWLAVSRGGRLAAVTNVRSTRVPHPSARSRGSLVTDFLMGSSGPRDYLGEVWDRRTEYRDFNLIAAESSVVGYVGSRGSAPRMLGPGVYGLSNAGLDTPWPKVERVREGLSALVADDGPVSAQDLFDLLADRAPAPEEALPDTGIGRAWERALSPAFIVTPGYGTRASTVVLFRAGGTVEVGERSFGPGGALLGEEAVSFPLANRDPAARD